MKSVITLVRNDTWNNASDQIFYRSPALARRYIWDRSNERLRVREFHIRHAITDVLVARLISPKRFVVR